MTAPLPGSGNHLVDAQDAMPDPKVCRICDCEDEHVCAECQNQISEETCHEYHGVCCDCSYKMARL